MAHPVYDEAMIKEATYNTRFRGKVCNMIRYADDNAVVSNTQKGLQQHMDDLIRVTRDYGMKINVKRTKFMRISHKGNCTMKIQIDGQLVEQVSDFKYLGSLISEDRYCEKEIHSRKALGMKIFMDKKRLFTGKLNLDLKKQIVKCLVWGVALYAAETWKLTQADRSKLEAFKTCILRRMEKISWVDKNTNEEIMNMVQEDRKILNTMRCHKHKSMGHVLRHDGLLCDVLERKDVG